MSRKPRRRGHNQGGVAANPIRSLWSTRRLYRPTRDPKNMPCRETSDGEGQLFRPLEKCALSRLMWYQATRQANDYCRNSGHRGR